MFSTRQLSEQLGVEISGIDLSVPLAEDVLRKFLDVFYRNSVVVVQGQSLDLDCFNQFACYFGRPKPHFLGHLGLPGFDSILLLSNIHDDGKPTGVSEPFSGTALLLTKIR